MSSAQLRSFRHTATVIALEIESALAKVAAGIHKTAETIGRQREGERKRQRGNKGSNERDKSLAAKAAEISNKITKVTEYLREFFDGCVSILSKETLAYLFMAVCLFIGIVMPKLPSEPTVFVRWVFGSKLILPTFWKEITFAM